jgi:hypothetical protein
MAQMKPPFIVKTFGLALLLEVVCLLFTLAACSKRPTTLSRDAEPILRELLSVGLTIRDLMPTPDGREIWYIRGTATGRGLYCTETASSRERMVVTSEVTTIYGWSPDGRRLVFAQAGQFYEDPPFALTGDIATWFPFWGREYPREEWLTVCDRQTGHMNPLTGDKHVELGWEELS